MIKNVFFEKFLLWLLHDTMSSDEQIIERLQHASKLMQEDALFEDALNVFDAILKEKEAPTLNANVDKFEGPIHGIRGECLFSLNRMPYAESWYVYFIINMRLYREAIEATQLALDASKDSDDDEGIVSLYINLYEIYRYISDQENAIKMCEKIVDLFGKIGDEKSKLNYQRQCEVLKKGEPLNRVIAVLDGVNYEVEGMIHCVELP